MSSLAVRTAFKTFMAANSAEKLVDMTGHFEDIEDMLKQQSPPIGMLDPWLGIYFVANDELPITVPATNDEGKYRETGIIEINVVGVAKLGASDTILGRADTLQSLLRGRRIGVIKVESISPPNFELGTTLEFEAGFISATLRLEYEADKDL